MSLLKNSENNERREPDWAALADHFARFDPPEPAAGARAQNGDQKERQERSLGRWRLGAATAAAAWGASAMAGSLGLAVPFLGALPVCAALLVAAHARGLAAANPDGVAMGWREQKAQARQWMTLIGGLARVGGELALSPLAEPVAKALKNLEKKTNIEAFARLAARVEAAQTGFGPALQENIMAWEERELERVGASGHEKRREWAWAQMAHAEPLGAAAMFLAHPFDPRGRGEAGRTGLMHAEGEVRLSSGLIEARKTWRSGVSSSMGKPDAERIVEEAINKAKALEEAIELRRALLLSQNPEAAGKGAKSLAAASESASTAIGAEKRRARRI